MAFKVPPGGGPLTFVVHVTRPKGDPVTTVPFVMTMTETAPGVFGFSRLKTEEECPPVPADRVLIADGTDAPRLALASNPAPADPGRPKEPPLPPPDTRTTPPIPPPLGERPTEPPLPPPDLRTTTPPPAPVAAAPPATITFPSGETVPLTLAPRKEIASLAEFKRLYGAVVEQLLDERVLLDKAAKACAAGTPPGRGEPGWADLEARYRKRLQDFLDDMIVLDPVGPEAQAIEDAKAPATVTVHGMLQELKDTPPPTCPPRLPDDPGPPESILDDVDEVRPLG